MEWAIPGAIVALLCIFAGTYPRRRRKSELVARYGDVATVRSIMAGDIRHGMNEEMIMDALGHPEKIDTLVTASGTIRILRYGALARGGFSGRIRLEDGIVVGWGRE